MNITWKISNIEWIEELNGFSKVVKNVHYWVEARDDDGNMGYTWGNIQLPVDNLTSFADFDTLTEDVVIEWAKAALNQIYVGENTTNVALQEEHAREMCKEQDPFRKRGIGTPW